MTDTLPFKECKKHGVLEDKDKKWTSTNNKRYIRCKLCSNLSNKKWKIINSDKYKEIIKNWTKNNREKHLRIKSISSKKMIRSSPNKYINYLIKRSLNLEKESISEELTEAYRYLLTLKRYQRDIKDGKKYRE